MKTLKGPEGFRRQITFEEAAQLADVEGPRLTFDYPALRLVQSPLFQRMGEQIDANVTQQNLGRIAAVEQQNDLQQAAMSAGVTRTDLEEIMNQMSRMQGMQGPLFFFPRRKYSHIHMFKMVSSR